MLLDSRDCLEVLGQQELLVQWEQMGPLVSLVNEALQEYTERMEAWDD